MEARQAALSRKTLLAGQIYFNSRSASVECIVRELSDQGALLQCVSSDAVPTNIFELYIPAKGEYYPAAVKERSGTEMRVSFIETGPSSESLSANGGMATILDRLARVEGEVKKLRQTVNDLKDRRHRDEEPGI